MVISQETDDEMMSWSGDDSEDDDNQDFPRSSTVKDRAFEVSKSKCSHAQNYEMQPAS